MIVLLDANTLGEIDLSGPDKWGDYQIYQSTKPAEVIERCREAKVVITNKVVFPKDLLEQLSELKLIIVTATGVNNIDIQACKELGIQVKNAAGYSTNSVVTHTFSMLFHFLHPMENYNCFTSGKKWIDHESFCFFNDFHELSSRHWGIIGLGEIGSNVAGIAKSFGCEVSYFSTSGENKGREYTHLDLAVLLSTCDIISIHAPLNSKTTNLIGKEELDKLNPGATLLNLGRGGIINEVDLAEFLENKTSVNIGLDVVEQEPMPADSPLISQLGKKNFLCTPHLAWPP